MLYIYHHPFQSKDQLQRPFLQRMILHSYNPLSPNRDHQHADYNSNLPIDDHEGPKP